MVSRRRAVTGILLLGGAFSHGGSMDTRNSTNLIEQGVPGGWYVINDGVMGGISRSRVSFTARGTMLFSGEVSLENNGGFASVRHDALAFGLGQEEGIRLRVKGDGKTYQLRVRTSDGFDGIAYKSDFRTLRDVWQDEFIPWERFTATYRGRTVKDAPELEGQPIHQVGFLIADKQEGPFALEIEFLGSPATTSPSR